MYYALKVPLESDQRAVDVNVNEGKIMGEVHCTHVLPLVEKRPCVSGKKLGSAFVTKLVPGDLNEWSQQAPGRRKRVASKKITTRSTMAWNVFTRQKAFFSKSGS